VVFPSGFPAAVAGGGSTTALDFDPGKTVRAGRGSGCAVGRVSGRLSNSTSADFEPGSTDLFGVVAFFVAVEAGGLTARADFDPGKIVFLAGVAACDCSAAGDCSAEVSDAVAWGRMPDRPSRSPPARSYT
jgi:hypothetical protein